MSENTTPAPGVSCIDDVAPSTIPVKLTKLCNSAGEPLTVHCEVMNKIEIVRRTGRLPGHAPPPATPDQAQAIADAQADPEQMAQLVYPVIIAGAFLADRDGKLVRPTFSLEEEPGKVCVRRVHDDDLLAMAVVITGQPGGLASALASFPDDAGRRRGGVGAAAAGPE